MRCAKGYALGRMRGSLSPHTGIVRIQKRAHCPYIIWRVCPKGTFHDSSLHIPFALPRFKGHRGRQNGGIPLSSLSVFFISIGLFIGQNDPFSWFLESGSIRPLSYARRHLPGPPLLFSVGRGVHALAFRFEDFAWHFFLPGIDCLPGVRDPFGCLPFLSSFEVSFR